MPWLKRTLAKRWRCWIRFFEDAPADAKPLWYLGESLKYLASADLAVFARDWACARDCRIEHAAAEEYGIPMMEV